MLLRCQGWNSGSGCGGVVTVKQKLGCLVRHSRVARGGAIELSSRDLD